MKINTIKLNNIGPYKGCNVFELESSSSKKNNVTLIGGKNGTGKTTLLKSIKIGLFGCFSFGFKTANATYFNEIKNLLNNTSKQNEKFYIEITLSYIENYKNNIYTIHREWFYKNNEITELIQVKKGDIHLNEYDSLEFENKLRSLTSPALINSFIYDGEKISSIIEQNQLEIYIKEMFNSIFNIDLLDQLSIDLTNYMIKSYKSGNKNAEYDISRILNNLNFVKSEIRTNEDYFNDIIKDIENIKFEIAAKKKEFATLGGLSKNTINEIAVLVNSTEKEKEDNNNFIKTYSEEFLPLALLTKELRSISRKAKKELPIKYANQLVTIQKYLNIDLSVYINKLREQTKTAIFDLEENKISELDNLIINLEKETKKATEILSSKSLSDNLFELKDKLDKNLSMTKLTVLANEIEKLQIELSNKNEKLNNVSHVLKENKQEKENLIRQYDNFAENIKKDKLTNSSYIQCSNSLQLCELFKNKIIENKLKAVSECACDIFNKTIRKNDYIKRMLFEKDFSFKLYDGNDREISPRLLSAGEMQILVSSLIWAMFKISGRKEMFVFDTPLARLDVENRMQFIKNIITTISDQVIILSTDSEFIGDNLKSVENNLFKKYLLEYNDKTKTTKITSEYFGGLN